MSGFSPLTEDFFTSIHNDIVNVDNGNTGVCIIPSAAWHEVCRENELAAGREENVKTPPRGGRDKKTNREGERDQK